MSRSAVLRCGLMVGSVVSMASVPIPASATPAAETPSAPAQTDDAANQTQLKAIYAMTIWEMLHADGPPSGRMSRVAERVSGSLTEAGVDHPARVLSAAERAEANARDPTVWASNVYYATTQGIGDDNPGGVCMRRNGGPPGGGCATIEGMPTCRPSRICSRV